jgi:YVTN family beta-propeller protein
MKQVITIAILIVALFTSCTSEDNNRVFEPGKGVFVVNEGNYLAGNGSLSFYNLKNGTIYNDLFSAKNTRLLGDIPEYLAVDGSVGYIVVNNSGTIERIDMNTMQSTGTVTDLNSPRQMVIYNGKGYVSSLYSTKITVIDLSSFSVETQIEIGCTTEALAVSGTTLFAANWSGGSKVVALDLTTNSVIKSITTGMEPESMVIDKNGKLWVLCTGGWNNEEIPRFSVINTSTLVVESTLLFRTVSDNPSCLAISSGADTLYYIDEGIRRMPVTATEIATTVLAGAGTSLFYKVAPVPWKGMFCVTDAVDYTQTGRLLIYDKNGNLIDTEYAGIIPGFMRYTD